MPVPPPTRFTCGHRTPGARPARPARPFLPPPAGAVRSVLLARPAAGPEPGPA